MMPRRSTRFAVSVYDPRLKRTVTVGTYDTMEEAHRELLARSAPLARHTLRHTARHLIERQEPSPPSKVDRMTARLWARAGRGLGRS
jgi:hypothetical protein